MGDGIVGFLVSGFWFLVSGLLFIDHCLILFEL